VREREKVRSERKRRGEKGKGDENLKILEI
jgi:hypothetical protein